MRGLIKNRQVPIAPEKLYPHQSHQSDRGVPAASPQSIKIIRIACIRFTKTQIIVFLVFIYTLVKSRSTMKIILRAVCCTATIAGFASALPKEETFISVDYWAKTKYL